MTRFTIPSFDHEIIDMLSPTWLQAESVLVPKLIQVLSDDMDRLILSTIEAKQLVQTARNTKIKGFKISLDSFMHVFELSKPESRALMTLAESFLRIPDNAVKDALLYDRLVPYNWKDFLGQSNSKIVNLAVRSLILGKSILKYQPYLKSMVRMGTERGVNFMAEQFVLAKTIKAALKIAESQYKKKQYFYSFDMLGEAAWTNEDALKYFHNYEKALDVIVDSLAQSKREDVKENNGISVKLSAICDRYYVKDRKRVLTELYDRLKQLCLKAKRYEIPLFVDAEESERLELSLELFKKLAYEGILKDWNGFGIVVQAYQKRALSVMKFIDNLGKETNTHFMVRLVKGAYWDTEIKRAQVLGLINFPVFTHKSYTDVNYLCVAKYMFESAYIYPCFATHSAVTIANITAMSEGRFFELQRLHGMGDLIYNQIDTSHKVRVYAPVGVYNDLLPYLVRRLLENGANSSFVSQILNYSISVDRLVENPVKLALSNPIHTNELTVLSENIFPNRKNAKGIDMTDYKTLSIIQKEMNQVTFPVDAYAIVNGKHVQTDNVKKTVNPGMLSEHIGNVHLIEGSTLFKALDVAYYARDKWDQLGVKKRAQYLEKAADEIESRMSEFMAYIIHEGGRTLDDAVSEVREAIDFLRYYASQGKKIFAKQTLPGVTGENNYMLLHGRGVFACVAPWNFPLAIFLGQVSAALISGNTVIAKPASATPIVAYKAIEALLNSGIPNDVLQLLLTSGKELDNLIKDPRIAGVVFTGSTEVAMQINRNLASRPSPELGTLIAETGGQNAMIVDSSALSEQVTRDVIAGAFQSAGQRCSALRVLFLQEDIADKQINMIKGAMKDLHIGNQLDLKTDIGPVIDDKALHTLQAHLDDMKKNYTFVAQAIVDDNADGHYLAPAMVEIPSINVLKKEVFGPILHVVRYKSKNLNTIMDEINNTGYGLTMAIHSRIHDKVDKLISKAKVGNIYVNRNQIGAVVESQPFGGEGASGTGSKAGGSHYLLRFIYEKSVSIDNTAEGGNATLMAKVK